jgi:hypothetical protein
VRRATAYAIERPARARHEPHEAVDFGRRSFALDDQADGVGEALRRVRHVAGQHEHFTLANAHVPRLSTLDGLQHHVSFELIEKFLHRRDSARDSTPGTQRRAKSAPSAALADLALLQMIVVADVRPTNNHYL